MSDPGATESPKAERSEAQQEASRRNGAKSRGPTSPEGKAKVRFNGVKHGLRAEQLILPGEDPAAFEAERQAWLDDWRPRSHTRAVLCERAAEATWRLRRAARSETARLRDRAREAVRALDLADARALQGARHAFDYGDDGASYEMEAVPAGIEHLDGLWRLLDGILAREPEHWSNDCHVLLMRLLGHRHDANPTEAGPMLLLSARLLAGLDPSLAPKGVEPLPKAERAGAAADLRELCDDGLARLAKIRDQVAARAARSRSETVDASLVDDSPTGRLAHRYEMSHDRMLRATINQLMALDRSGADLAEPEPVAVEPVEPVSDPGQEAGGGATGGSSHQCVLASDTGGKTHQWHPSEPEPSEAEAPSEPEPGAVPEAPNPSDRDRSGRTWPVGAVGGPGSPS